MKTPEISVLEAQKEIHCFAERIQRMFGMVKELLGETNDDKFIKLYTRIEKYEGISDNMEIEIAKYLDQVSDSHLSDETKAMESRCFCPPETLPAPSTAASVARKTSFLLSMSTCTR